MRTQIATNLPTARSASLTPLSKAVSVAGLGAVARARITTIVATGPRAPTAIHQPTNAPREARVVQRVELTPTVIKAACVICASISFAVCRATPSAMGWKTATGLSLVVAFARVASAYQVSSVGRVACMTGIARTLAGATSASAANAQRGQLAVRLAPAATNAATETALHALVENAPPPPADLPARRLLIVPMLATVHRAHWASVPSRNVDRFATAMATAPSRRAAAPIAETVNAPHPHAALLATLLLIAPRPVLALIARMAHAPTAHLPTARSMPLALPATTTNAPTPHVPVAIRSPPLAVSAGRAVLLASCRRTATK